MTNKRILKKIELMKSKDARLMTISALDKKTLVYHFMIKGKVTNIKTKSKKGQFKSIVNIFPNAEFYEREIMELFGVKFTGHPNPKRLFTSKEIKKPPFSPK